LNLKIDEKTLTWITDRWERKSTILILMIVVFLVLIIKFSGSNLSDISLSELVFILGITVLLYLIWLFSIRIPTNKKNHFGFCIAIKSETKSHSDKIKSDFINILQNLLDIKSEVFKYNIVLLPDHLTKKIKNNTKAKQFLFKTKCHFMIYGFTRVRAINGTDVHLLNIDQFLLTSKNT
jgi:hypothetical protein